MENASVFRPVHPVQLNALFDSQKGSLGQYRLLPSQQLQFTLARMRLKALHVACSFTLAEGLLRPSWLSKLLMAFS